MILGAPRQTFCVVPKVERMVLVGIMFVAGKECSELDLACFKVETGIKKVSRLNFF